MFDDWQAMIAEFEALGGVFENITCRMDGGNRGLFPTDPTKHCRLHVPASLLIPEADVRLVDGNLTVATDSAAAPEARAFFENYHRVTSWSDGGRAAVEKTLLDLQQLPSACKRLLDEGFGLGRLFRPVTPEIVLQHFLRARRIALDGETYLAPLLELSNHDPLGPKIDSGANGISLSGVFAQQVAWRYRTADSFQMFRSYQFASVERFTFSLPFDVLDKRLKKNIRISIDTSTRERREAPVPIPVVTPSDAAVDLSFVVLGDRADPRNGQRSFTHDLLPQLGVNGLEFFEGLLFYNRQRFLQLLATVEEDTSPAAPLIRKVCRLQLEGLNAVSFQ